MLTRLALTRPLSLSMLVLTALFGGAVGCVRAASGSGPNVPQPRQVPAHDTFTVQSRALGKSRPINVNVPRRSRAAAGMASNPLPVLYMPDGGVDEDFPHVVHAVDSLIARGAIRPVLVVGVPSTERRRDLTGPTRIAADSATALWQWAP